MCRRAGFARRVCATMAMLVLAVACAAVVGISRVARARPGGGESFSSGNEPTNGGGGGVGPGGGGGGGQGPLGVPGAPPIPSSSSSNGGDGTATLLIIFGLFAVTLVLVWLKLVHEHRAARNWTASSVPQDDFIPRSAPLPKALISARNELIAILANDDPDFSSIVFEDFAYALYASMQSARGSKRLDELAPWISLPVRSALAAATSDLCAVETVVIGAMTIVSAVISVTAVTKGAYVMVELQFEANYTEVVGAARSKTTYYVKHRLTLRRAVGVKSKSPESVRLFRCPSCGAPLREEAGGGRAPEPSVCAFCRAAVGEGRFDWELVAIRLLQKEPRAPQLAASTEERGTNLPTIIDRDASAHFEAILARDQALSWDALQARIRLIWNELQRGWTLRDLRCARPYVSDNFFAMQTYWIECYRRAHLVNVCQNRITNIVAARATTDRYYDAVTVRIFACGLDFVTDEQGAVRSGSPSIERAFTEYWTFIRGVRIGGPARVDQACPSCGGALQINMIGACVHCGAKVASGQFDWVLSRIEQDETYAG